MVRRPFGLDLFRWAVGVIEVGIAIVLLLAPSQLSSPAYADIRPNAIPLGLLLLVAGSQFIALAAIRPVAERRPSVVSGVVASAPLFILANGYWRADATSDAVLAGVLGLGCFLGPALVHPSSDPSPTGSDDILFYAVGLTQFFDGALMLLAPRRFPATIYGGVATYFAAAGWLLLAVGLLLLLTHAQSAAPRRLVGTTHALAIVAFIPLVQTAISPASAWIGLVAYFTLDAFVLSTLIFHGKPGVLHSDSLAVRLSALIVLVAAVPLIYTSVVTSANVRSTFQRHISGDQLTLAEVAASRLTDLLTASQQEIDALGHYDGIRGMDPETHRAVLELVGHALPQFTSIVTCDLDGNEIARSDNFPTGYCGGREFFETARSGHVTWEYLLSQTTHQPVIVFATPIRGSDQRVSGVLFGTVGRDVLANVIDDSALEVGSRVFLVDQDGQVLVESGEHDPSLTRVTTIPALSATSGIVSLPLEGDTYLAGVSPVQPPGWKIVVAQREATAFADIDRVQRVTLLTFAIAILGMIAAAGAIARLITRPIAQLTVAAEALARGDDRAPLPRHASGEVGVLVRSFGWMRDARRAHEAALIAREQRARGVASVAVALGHSHGFEDALVALCRELMITLDCSFCAAFLVEDEWLVAHGLSVSNERIAEAYGSAVPLASDALPSRVFRAGEAALIGDVDEPARAGGPAENATAVKSGLAIPLTVGGERRGVLLALEVERPQNLGVPELELVRAVIGTADLILENACLDEENDRRRIEAEHLASQNAALYAMERSTADALRASQAEIERFVYTVSHDLRAPLVTIQGFSQRVLQHYGSALDDRGRDYLGRVQKNAQRLEALINDLLQLSRIGRTDLDVQTIALADLAEEVRGQLAVQLESRKISFVVADGLPTVVANRYRLGQVLENLVENAILYMGSPGAASPPTIRLDARAIDDGWQVVVTDNGVGIPEEHRERVFNVFERLSAGKAVHPEGTGIGLATVKKIVETHGGRVWVEDTPGGGATIAFTIKAIRKDKGWPARE